MLLTLEFIAELFPDYNGHLDKTAKIHAMLTDSREEKADSLFVPLAGDNFDGHAFLLDAVRSGAMATLWQNDKPLPQEVPDDFLVFFVEDTLGALQSLAKAYRDRVNPTVVGITGSNGKTTTKDLLYAVLKNAYTTHATIGNFNNEIGLPLTILQMPANTDVLILEMGMNHFNEIEQLAKLAQPDYAIITNIGESHIEYLGSRTGIAKAKLEITQGLKLNGVLLIDGDEPLLMEEQSSEHVVSCGFTSDVTVEISDVTIGIDNTSFLLNHEKPLFSVPLLGRHHAKNASYVIALARKLGMNDQEIQKGLEGLAHSAMRFEQIRGKNGVLLINDAYNASVTSTKAAIEVVKELKAFKKRVVVLGDVLELGVQSKKLHGEIAAAIDEKIDYVYTYGKEAKEITTVLKKDKPGIVAVHFTNRTQLEKALQAHFDSETLILFKASRMMAFEQFIEVCK